MATKRSDGPRWILKSPVRSDVETPSWDEIVHELRELMARDPDEDYLILDKCGEAWEGISISYLQARPHRVPFNFGMFLVEYQDGKAGRHYRGHIEADEPLEALFRSYWCDDDRWKRMVVWRDISTQFPFLHPALPPEELPDSYFSEGEYAQVLHEHDRRNEKFWASWEQGLEADESTQVLVD